MDILFKNDDFVFSYRIGGILIRDGKILLQRPKNDDYSIISGRSIWLPYPDNSVIRDAET